MSAARILIIEDEPKVALFIAKGLEENNFEPVVAYDGEEGLRKAQTENFELVILDLNLPGINGLNVCTEIRKTNVIVPVLMLTALGTTDDKLNGFESGADDYLVKPFEFRELLARIKVLIKRSTQKNSPGNILKIADLELNSESKIVKRQGQLVELTSKEFSLLELLMRNKEKVISRAEIAEKIWDINFDTGTNVIDVYINFLRKKIDKNFSEKLIHTHIGMGYTLRKPGT